MIANYVKAGLMCPGALGMSNNSVTQTSGTPIKNTMVVTHLPSNILLTLVPLMPNLWIRRCRNHWRGADSGRQPQRSEIFKMLPILEDAKMGSARGRRDI
jgi:hypothetical protein